MDFDTEKWVRQGRFRTMDGRRAHAYLDEETDATCLLVDAPDVSELLSRCPCGAPVPEHGAALCEVCESIEQAALRLRERNAP